MPGDGKLENDDNSWGFGANLGVMYEVNKTTRFGLTYCSEVSFEFKDTLDISGIAIIGTLSRKLELEFDKPQTLMASFYHGLNDQWAILIGEFLTTFKEFPPRQKPAKINMDEVMKTLLKAANVD